MATKRRKLTKEDEYELLNGQPKDTSGGDIISKINIAIKAKSDNQKKLINLIGSKEIIICNGPPGTGKTFLSISESLRLLKSNQQFKRILLVKSVTTLKGEEIGYLKGTLEEKIEPFMYSFISNFEKIIGRYNTKRLREMDIIEEMPIAYMRGISIDNSIIIIDECQNITIDNMRTIMTRLGENSKMIFLGDENQIDLRNKKESSLQFIINHFSDIDEIGAIQFSENDIVRNPLIRKIEKVFDSIAINGK